MHLTHNFLRGAEILTRRLGGLHHDINILVHVKQPAVV